MIANNAIWVNRRKFTVRNHSLHYFAASTIMLLYLPWNNPVSATTSSKYIFTLVNILIFQMFLGRLAALTSTHSHISLLVTLIYLLVAIIYWFPFELKTLGVWDGNLHLILLPLPLMLTLTYVSFQERFKNDKKIVNEFDDLKKILGSLSQGVALTVNFPHIV